MFQRSLRSSVQLVLLLTAIVGGAQAGSGEIVDGKLNISVMFTYEESDLASWRPLFEEGSRLLYNATNGQLQLGTVRVINCGFASVSADVWVLSGEGGAFATVFDPELGTGLGGDGHVFLTETHRSTTGDAFGQFGLVHELGHYVFGIFDEYDGFVRETPRLPVEQTRADLASNQFCVSELHEHACIMDGGTTVPPTNRRTEFCTSTDGGLGTAHNPGVVVDGLRFENAQQALNGMSCWETITNTLGLDSPGDVDLEDPNGLEPIEWQIADDRDRIVVCLDKSGSMEGPAFELARGAAKAMIDLLHERKTIEIQVGEETMELEIPGEDVGLISFSDGGDIDFPVGEVTGGDVKDALREAVDEITPGGGTAIGSALGKALGEIMAQGPIPACSEAILVVSDGINTKGPAPMSMLPMIQERGVKIHTVALGMDADIDLMQTLAGETNGRFFFASTAAELPGIFSEVSSTIRSGGTIENVEGRIGGGENATVAFRMDGFGEEVTAVLQWEEGVLDMFLTNPDGALITVESADVRPDVEAVRREGFIYIRVIDPTPGAWICNIVGTSLPEPTDFELFVLAEGRPVSMVVSTGQDVHDFPEPVRLRVDLIANQPVAGAEVTAEVDRPGGAPVTINVFDDGDPLHGDSFAQDGVYAAVFDDFAGDGMYTFRVRAVNTFGTGPDLNLPFVEEGGDSIPKRIPPFTREAEVSVQVRSVPGILAATFDFELESIDIHAAELWRVAGYLELPEGFDVADVDLSTVRLQSGVPVAESAVGDYDEDGIPDLELQFDGGLTATSLREGMQVEVRLNGALTSGEPFAGADLVNVIDGSTFRPMTVAPDVIPIGESVRLAWPVMEADAHYDGYLSRDGGRHWTRIFSGEAHAREFAWTAEAPRTANAVVLVEALTLEGAVAQSISNPFRIDAGLGSVAAVDVPAVTAFLGVTPNPAPSVLVRYALAEAGDVTLDVHDVTGRLVRRLGVSAQPAGTHAMEWDGRDRGDRPVSTGIYFYVFEAGDVRETGRMMIVR